MWENTKKKRIILNIFLGLLIVAVVAVLGYFVMQIQAENQAHDEELSKIYEQQQRQQSEARQESVSAIDEQYARQMQTVQFLPSK